MIQTPTLKNKCYWPANGHLPSNQSVTENVVHIPNKEAKCKQAQARVEEIDNGGFRFRRYCITPVCALKDVRGTSCYCNNE